jgi:heptosyltransferase-2
VIPSERPGAPRFLVLAPQGLGDALEATPLVAALRRAFPGATIHVLVLREQTALLFRGLPALADRVIYLPYWASRFGFLRALGASLARRPRYDASFLAYPAARPAYHLVAFAYGARRRYAHRYFEPSPRNLLGLHTDLVPVAHKHNVLRNMDLLAAAGIPFDPPTEYSVPGEWREAERDPDRFVLHVGSIAHDGLERKRWPAERFETLARRLLASGYRVTLLCGPAERELTQRVHAGATGAELFEGSLQEAARLLSSSGMVICNDSGIAHLAAGLGTPVISIHGPTPVEFGPYGRWGRPLRPSDCPPCFDPRLLNTDCLLNIDYACLRRDVTVDRVFAEATALHAEFLREPREALIP